MYVIISFHVHVALRSSFWIVGTEVPLTFRNPPTTLQSSSPSFSSADLNKASKAVALALVLEVAATAAAVEDSEVAAAEEQHPDEDDSSTLAAPYCARRGEERRGLIRRSIPKALGKGN